MKIQPDSMEKEIIIIGLDNIDELTMKWKRKLKSNILHHFELINYSTFKEAISQAKEEIDRLRAELKKDYIANNIYEQNIGLKKEISSLKKEIGRLREINFNCTKRDKERQYKDT